MPPHVFWFFATLVFYNRLRKWEDNLTRKKYLCGLRAFKNLIHTFISSTIITNDLCINCFGHFEIDLHFPGGS